MALSKIKLKKNIPLTNHCSENYSVACGIVSDRKKAERIIGTCFSAAARALAAASSLFLSPYSLWNSDSKAASLSFKLVSTEKATPKFG
jgi:hypothetical protein